MQAAMPEPQLAITGRDQPAPAASKRTRVSFSSGIHTSLVRSFSKGARPRGACGGRSGFADRGRFRAPGRARRCGHRRSGGSGRAGRRGRRASCAPNHGVAGVPRKRAVRARRPRIRFAAGAAPSGQHAVGRIRRLGGANVIDSAICGAENMRLAVLRTAVAAGHGQITDSCHDCQRGGGTLFPRPRGGNDSGCRFVHDPAWPHVSSRPP